MERSKQQDFVTLSVTESELCAATSCTQDMMYCTCILDLLGLKVQKPMTLEVDNKGAVDLANNWTIGGRTRHIEVRQGWVRELKEQGLLKVVWQSGEGHGLDIFTKNLAGPAFEKHAVKYIG